MSAGKTRHSRQVAHHCGVEEAALFVAWDCRLPQYIVETREGTVVDMSVTARGEIATAVKSDAKRKDTVGPLTTDADAERLTVLVRLQSPPFPCSCPGQRSGDRPSTLHQTQTGNVGSLASQFFHQPKHVCHAHSSESGALSNITYVSHKLESAMSASRRDRSASSASP